MSKINNYLGNSITPKITNQNSVQNKKTLILPISLWITLLVVLIISVKKYKSCQDRIPLTYLILGFSIVSFVVLQLIYQYYDINVNSLLAFVLSIIFLVITHIYKPNSKINTLFFALFIISFSFILQPLFKLGDKMGIAKPALFTVCIWFLILTLISVYYPNMITPQIKNILFFSLIFLLIFRIILLFTKPLSKTIRISAYLGIIIFSGFVLYDSKMMRFRASQCDHPYEYINNSIGLFLDFVNLWSDTMVLGVTRR
jgi:FtsH-binding integral membrane protein